MQSTRAAVTVLLLAVTAAPAPAGISEPTFLGPIAYTSAADSPWDFESFGTCYEDFENGVMDPIVTGNGAIIAGGLTDSVDGDDGSIDGSGSAGRSYFSGNGSVGITVNFDAEFTGGFPTAAGIVWTDGAGMITFEAFDSKGMSLGINGPHAHAGGGSNGETAEDRFYGVTYGGGISAIKVTNSSGGIEVDHLQLNNCFICGDAVRDFERTASDALFTLKSAVGTETCSTCVCDANDSDSLTAVDALSILKFAVGQPVALNCPDCVIF